MVTAALPRAAAIEDFDKHKQEAPGRLAREHLRQEN
jgi:hypothetical protein